MAEARARGGGRCRRKEGDGGGEDGGMKRSEVSRSGLEIKFVRVLFIFTFSHAKNPKIIARGVTRQDYGFTFQLCLFFA